ncbi:flagellar hook-associated protein FlgK [Desulfurobacterium crinifex]
MNIFSMFNTGKQGLFTSQYEMSIVDQNLANLGTDGYSREAVSKEATVPYPGVNITRVYRKIDPILEKKINQVSQDLGYYTSKSQYLGYIETITNELNDGSLTEKLASFFNAWSDLANEAATMPADLTAPSPVRAALIQKAEDLAKAIQDRYLGIQNMRKDTKKDITYTISQINKLLRDIANYNKAISKTDTPEKEAAVLKDKRQKALNDLAQLIDITYIEQPDKTVTVYGPPGSLLVTADTVWPIVMSEDNIGSVHVFWYTGKEYVEIHPEKGKLGALLEINNQKIPEYTAYLDNLASTIMDSVNNIHSQGWSIEGTTGINFFTGTGAGDIAVNSKIVENPNRIATSSLPDTVANNDIALQIYELQNQKIFASNSMAPAEYIAAFTAQIGVDTKNSTDNKNVTDAILSALKEKKSSISEVNKDEELAKLMVLEKQFQAASKIITVADELLTTVINMIR